MKTTLSKFENRVYCLAMRGLTNKQMAGRLNVNEASIRSAWRRILNKNEAKMNQLEDECGW